MRVPVFATAIAALSLAASAQTSPDEFSRIPSTQTVRIYLRDGTVVKGKISGGSGDQLSVVDKSRTVGVAKPNVTRVTRKSRAWGAMWGGIVGFGIAAPIGAYAGPYIGDIGNPSGSTRFRHAMGFGAFFAGVGAGIGALAGSEKTIYRAR